MKFVSEIWLKFWNNWKKYSKNLTMHGCLYFSESKSVIELIFWLLSVGFCLALCIWLILINWFRYQSNPTVTSIRTNAYPTSNIEFPAVTVCNINTVYRRNILELQNVFVKAGIEKNLTEDFFKDLKNLMLAANVDATKYRDIYDVLADMDFDSEKLMRNLTQPCKEMLVNCRYFGMVLDCSKFFMATKTGYGYCCEFVGRANFKNLQIDGEMDHNLTNAGAALGLMLTINVEPQEDTSRIYPYYAAIVMVHHYLDFPDLTTFSSALQPGDFTLMQVLPTVFNCDEEELIKMEISKRNCLLGNEGHLISREEYSFKNCIIECKVKAIYKLCKCVPFYYPVIGDYKQCTLMDNICLKKNELIYNNFKLSMLEKDKNKININDTILCDCLPECSDITYSGNINAVKNATESNLATVQIFFQYAWCVEYVRTMSMTWDILLASLGGIYGLCLGGSFISLIEIAYFLIKSVYKTFNISTQGETQKNDIVTIKS